MTALLSLTVNLITSPFYQKRKQAGTAQPVKKRASTSEELSFARTYFVAKKLTV